VISSITCWTDIVSGLIAMASSALINLLFEFPEILDSVETRLQEARLTLNVSPIRDFHYS
jgi:hypothetical protein